MKIKTNLMFALIVALIGVAMGWLFGESYTNSMIGAGIFSVLSFVVMCIDDVWSPEILQAVEEEPEPVAEVVQET